MMRRKKKKVGPRVLMDNSSESRNHSLVFEAHTQPTKWQDYFKQNIINY